MNQTVLAILVIWLDVRLADLFRCSWKFVRYDGQVLASRILEQSLHLSVTKLLPSMNDPQVITLKFNTLINFLLPYRTLLKVEKTLFGQ